jgi:GNAT superfamily N-acetyltransferase
VSYGEVVIVLEQSVTKPFWEATRDYLRRRIVLGRYRKVGRTGTIEIPGGKYTTTYAIVVEDEPIAWLYLRSRPGWAALEVRQVFVHKDFRGQKLAQRLYKAAINTDGCLLASGPSHSKYSMGLWKKFIQKKTFNIWAHDFNNTRLHCQVEYDENGDLQCEFPVYTRLPGKHDIRFVAERK